MRKWPRNLCGAGRERDYFGLKKWLDDRQICLKLLAEEVGVHPVVASQTIRGIVNNRKFLARLLELGCPEKLLSLPSDMKSSDLS
jgi:hypothetical protein